MTSLLDFPARKVFARDISKSIRLRSSEIEESKKGKIKKKHKEWKVTCNGVEFSVTVVWIQGLVSEVRLLHRQINKEEGFLILDDSTGNVKVTGFNNIPFISPSLNTGQYLMVIGSVTRSGDVPVVNAVKLQSLAHVKNAEQSWSLEVMDQILHLGSENDFIRN
ncbi:recQ-mediated genome instability protein 2-like isoform X1 [Ostrea edulis]|uniref:recQ-mediated genome instability protein 2-like isoform X1 n=1 Tax=Ostrea edulis TaxID=37623 RepID=UPI0020948F61|nr:recQ-mediated genome instability protein 2-like isoform X1 [Ostrea edulis]